MLEAAIRSMRESMDHRSESSGIMASPSWSIALWRCKQGFIHELTYSTNSNDSTVSPPHKLTKQQHRASRHRQTLLPSFTPHNNTSL